MRSRRTARQVCPFQAIAGKAVEAVREVEKLWMRSLGMTLAGPEGDVQEMHLRRVEGIPADRGRSNVGPSKECLLQRSEAHFVRDSLRSNTSCYTTDARNPGD